MKPSFGLALGSGSARGLAHIGVLEQLEAADMPPSAVTGSSVGALVGGIYACGALEKLADWVRSFTRREVVRYLDFALVRRGGFVEGRKMIEYWRREIGDPKIEDLPIPFGAIGTDLETGERVVFDRGPLWEAVRASMAMPGLLTPAFVDDRWLVDGALSDPVPVSLCRALGAEVVVAVDLNRYLDARARRARVGGLSKALTELGESAEGGGGLLDRLPTSIVEFAGRLLSRDKQSSDYSVLEVMMMSLDITKVRITRAQLRRDPPDLVLTPRLPDLGLLEVYRAGEAIEQGRLCASELIGELSALIEQQT